MAGPANASGSTVAAPRLVPLSVARLAGNGLFRFIYPFLAVVAVDVGLGAGAEGLLITGLAVGGLLVPWVGGRLVRDGDAPQARTTSGIVALAVGAVGLAAAPAAGAAALVVALLSMVVLGLAKPLLDIGSMTYVSARVGWEGRGRALSTMELTWAGGLLVLAPASPLASVIGWRTVLVLLGASTLLTLPLLRRWLDDDDATRALLATASPSRSNDAAVQGAPPTTGPVPGVTAMFMVTVVLIFVALEVTFGVVSLWLEDVRGVDVAVISLLTALGALGELSGSGFTALASDRIGKARTAAIGLVACAVGFLVLSVAGPLPLALAGMVLGLFGTETAIVAGIALATELDPTRRSHILDRMVAMSSVSRALAGAAGPLVLLRGGIVANAATSAVAALLGAALLVVMLRRDPRLHG